MFALNGCILALCKGKVEENQWTMHLFIFTAFQIEEKKGGKAYTLRQLEHQRYMTHLSLLGDGSIRGYVI